jgi:hypothetical protein
MSEGRGGGEELVATRWSAVGRTLVRVSLTPSETKAGTGAPDGEKISGRRGRKG